MNDFEVMSKMSDGDMDIAMFPDILSVDKVKNGFKVTFGVPEAAGQKIINQMATGVYTHYPCFYLVNKEEFDKIKNADRSAKLSDV